MRKTLDTPRPDAPDLPVETGAAPVAPRRSPKRGAKTGAAPASSKKAGARAARKRQPSRKTFLVAATIPDEGGADGVRVYAAVTRSPEEALAAVRETLGAAVTVEFTGKLSGRMAKALGLTAGEVRRI